MTSIRYFTVKLLDGTLVMGRTLRDIKKIVGNAPFIPPQADALDMKKLKRRLPYILGFLYLTFLVNLGAVMVVI